MQCCTIASHSRGSNHNELSILAYNPETLLVVVNGSFYGYQGLIPLFQYCFLQPEIGIAHVVEPFLQLVKVHRDLYHTDTNGNHNCFLLFFNLIFNMVQYYVADPMLLSLNLMLGLSQSIIKSVLMSPIF